jgi:hypothetical protein
VSLLAAVVLAAATARVEGVSLAAVDAQLAVRVTLSGQPGMVSVHREGDAARVAVAGAVLGSRFTGGQRFSWIPSGIDTSRLADPSHLDRLEVVAVPSEVSVLLHVPPDVSIDVRRDRRGLLLVLRPATTSAGTATQTAAATPAAALPEPTPGMIVPRPVEPVAAAPAPAAAPSGAPAAPSEVARRAAEEPRASSPPPPITAVAGSADASTGRAAVAAGPPHASTDQAVAETGPAAVVAPPAPAPAGPATKPEPDTAALARTLFPGAESSTTGADVTGQAVVAASPPDASTDQAVAETGPAAVVTPPAPAPAGPATKPEPDTAELARSLFPGAESSTTRADVTGQAPVGALYGQLFPQGTPQTEPETVVVSEVEPVGSEQGVLAGPFRVQLGIDARYVDADTFVEASGQPVRDHYLEVAPRVAAQAPVGEGHLMLSYLPVLRAFATYDEVNSSSHAFGARLDAPLGPSIQLRVRDSFVHGLLDTRVVDPGGEYFFGLGAFNRNDAGADFSILTGPRLSLELGGLFSKVHFTQPSSFFDYDEWRGSAGLGYELSPTLKVITSYVYSRVPTPPDRPEAEAQANSGEVRLVGDITPLLSGSVGAGYRHQTSPNAGPDGRVYSGFVMNGSLTRQFSPDSSVTLYLDRSTPVSAYEENGFYVSTGVQGAARVPLPLELQLQGGLGYQWNDYRTPDSEIGVPREDRILALYVGLRRPIRRQLFVAATYRREERRSNVDRFDTNTDGFYLQLEWDIFGTAPR